MTTNEMNLSEVQMLEHALNGHSRGTSLASGYTSSAPTSVSTPMLNNSQCVQPTVADNNASRKQSILNPATASYFPSQPPAAGVSNQAQHPPTRPDERDC